MKRLPGAHLTLAVALIAAATAYAQGSPRTAFRVAREAGCMVCHDLESWRRGANDVIPNAPVFQDIACRYRSDPNAATGLSEMVREGTAPLRRDRHWTGRVAFDTMYPNDAIVTEAEARQIVDWIMTLCPTISDGRRSKRR